MVPCQSYASYKTLIGKLEALIARQRLDNREFLPSERELAVMLGTSRMTLRRALEVIEAKGLLIKGRRGRIIAPAGPAVKSKASLAFLAKGLDSIGNLAWARLWSAFHPLAETIGVRSRLALFKWDATVAEDWPGALTPTPDFLVFANAPSGIADKARALDNTCVLIHVDENDIGKARHLVTLDNERAGEMAAELILKAGYQRPAFIGWRKAPAYLPFENRAKGFEKIMRAKARHFDPQSMIWIHARHGAEFMRELLRVGDMIADGDFDALFLCSDENVSVVYHTVLEKKRIPEAFGLVTVAGSNECLRNIPPISSVSHADEGIAQAITAFIDEVMDGRITPATHTINQIAPEVNDGKTIRNR